MTKTVTVVGSGIAGLTAAYHLQKAGFTVVVLESDPAPGGRMADVTMQGLNVHSGATIIWDFYSDMMDLARELGIDDDLVDYQNEYTLDNGRELIKLNITPSIKALASYPGVSLASKVRLATLLPDMLRSGLTTDPNLLHTASQFDDGESIADYVTRKIGRDFLENYIDPLFRIPWSWKTEDISKAYLINILGHLTGARTMIFRKGIGQLTRALAGQVLVSYNTRVTNIATVPAGGVRVQLIRNGQSEEIHSDLVVCAVPGNRVEPIVTDLRHADFFRAVRYNSCAIVYHLLNQPPPPMDRWFSRETGSTIPFYAQIPDDPFTPRQPQPFHLYCELAPELIEQIAASGRKSGFSELIEPEVSRLYPAIAEQRIGTVEQWIEDMLPVIYPGYVRKLDSYLTSARSEHAEIYFCGDYLAHSHTGGACASGRMTATTIIDHHGSREQ